MAVFIKYQVGTCWSSVEEHKLAGCFTYFANICDAAEYALEMGTGVQPMEVYVDLNLFPELAFDIKGNRFKSANKNWGDHDCQPVIRHEEVLRLLAVASV